MTSDPIFHPLVPLLRYRETGPTVFVSGEGIYLTDSDGNRFVDGLSGLWNVNIGHGDERVQRAVAEQMREMEYAPSFFGYSSRPAEALARRLCELAPGDDEWKVFFTNGGSEAVETAIKLARYVQHARGFEDRHQIVGRERGYHGSTLATSSATGIANYWKRIGPLMPGFHHVAAPYCYRSPWSDDPGECGRRSAQAIEDKIVELGRESVAAVIAEPIQATGGVIVPPDGYLEQVRDVCDRSGALYIDDEVVCGFGRTGSQWGVDHAGVVPDMMSLAKGISSAYLPAGALLIRASLHAELEQFAERTGDFMLFHGFTTGGHPTVCAAALANLDVIRDDGLVERAAKVGEHLQSRLAELSGLPIVGEVRGRGLIAAVELVRDKETKEQFDPALKVGQRVVARAFEQGLICRAVGGSDIVALAPPLIVDEDQIDEIVEVLGASIEQVQQELEQGAPA